MVFNLNLAVNVLVQIERSQRDRRDRPGWEQNAWGRIHNATINVDTVFDEKTGLPVGVGSCTTAYCAGGWALHLSGIKLQWTAAPFSNGPMELIALTTRDGDPIEEKAREVLGIPGPDDPDYDEDRWDTDEDMPALFAANNSIDVLYYEVAALAHMDEPDLRNMVRVRDRAVKTDPLVVAGRVPQ